MVFFTENENDLTPVARAVIDACQVNRVVALYGSMGSGKTTFVKQLCSCLQVNDIVQSPTFSIVNEYKTIAGESVFHFDFYRIKKVAEAYDIGYEDYIYSGAWCFIEWPDLIESLLPYNTVRLYIEGESTRTYSLRLPQ